MTPADPAVDAALAALGLPGLEVIADPAGIAALAQTPGCRIGFAAALQQALAAFIGNPRGSAEHAHDAAMDAVRAMPEAFGLPPDPDDAAIGEALRQMLRTDPAARIVLLTPGTIAQPDYRFLPEFGEDIASHWVFRILAPASWPMLQWAIVDPRGETPAYSYGFD